MRRPLTRVMAATTAATLALTLLTAVPAHAEPDESSPGETGTGSSAAAERDALALAAETGQRVEIEALTDEKTPHFANPDGTLTAEISALPARVRTSDGWTDVDTTLVATDDGLVRPRATSADLTFSGGGNVPMVTLGLGSNSVSLDWDGDLPTPTLDGNQATYPDVLPDVDLVLTAGVEGFGQVLVVHTPEAAASPELAELELALDTVGVTMTSDEHGNLTATGNDGGRSVFSASAPTMWDSTGADQTTDGQDPAMAPLTTSQVEPVHTTVEVDALRLVPDEAMLTDEATEFPVYIDPSVSVSRPNWGWVDRAFPNTNYLNEPDEPSVGVGRIEWDRVYTRRAMFQFGVWGRTKQDTTTIHSATFRAEVDWAYDCNSDSHIQLHRIDRFDGSTTWNNQPTARDHLDTQNVTGGWATCPASSGVEFDATDAYQWGVDNDESYIYLRLKERDEAGTTAWRRFDVTDTPPVLVVDYNNKPSQVSTDSMSDALGGVCSTDPDNPRLINDTTTTFRATIRDYDARASWGGQKLKLRVEWRINGTEPREYADSTYADVGYWPDGSERTVTATGLPEGELLGYRAIAHDQTEWGYPWSDWCWIQVDTSKPEVGPQVTSTDYPAGDTQHGSVGHAGEFTFTNNGVESAESYFYSVNDASCSTEIALDSPGASATVPITPHRSGTNLIHARTVDAFGNSSECALVYTFTVAPPAQPVSYFPLDEGQGDTAADVIEQGRTATTTGTNAWTRGRVGQTSGGSHRLEGAAVELAGDSHLATTEAVIDTTDSFTVSAWVRLDELPDGNVTAVSQTGTYQSAFHLGYQAHSTQAWTFKMAPHDDAPTSGSTGWTYTTATAPAQLGVWTHLLGTYTPDNGELALYVNGVHQDTAHHPTAWNATDHLRIGGAQHRGDVAYQWPGAIDDVRLYDRVVADQPLTEDPDARSEIWELANRPVALQARWRLDETEGTVVHDSSDHGLDGTLNADPNTAWNQAFNDVTFAPGVTFDGAGEHIRASSAIRTDRSWSVAAWVRLDEASGNGTMVSQAGEYQSGFLLGHQSGFNDHWVLETTAQDVAGAEAGPWSRAISNQPAEFGRWTHLAATYDHTKGELTLFVDGQRQTTTGTWDGAWHSAHGVVIGRAWRLGEDDLYAGQLSDVHLYQGVLNEADLSSVMWGYLP
ncbi:LamG-like jellyroll fold domain-containing protein [Nocardiopsis sp. FIRDI 009]|uniref:LamG-like jellyroll fold domain-containing protein n=1 Tax=Nocardiopsis sp. FIRDI 009 TaxID=714197 RepID=UPI0018E50462|nr:LamG-like jellyroll fold domain-containing protein [Nocardiopsis sp. FIRDI 009]